MELSIYEKRRIFVLGVFLLFLILIFVVVFRACNSEEANESNEAIKESSEVIDKRVKAKGKFRYFNNFQRNFNDLNGKHLLMAKKFGIKPLASLEEAEESRKLERIETCSAYKIDKLTHSLPYLVPRAENLLTVIGENFQDSLASKGFDNARIIVTSVLRTGTSVAKLRKRNVNASKNSAHLYGTTFDIAYGRYDGGERNNTGKMKSVLAEVLRDLKQAEKCYVKYEYKQGCFHITTR